MCAFSASYIQIGFGTQNRCCIAYAEYLFGTVNFIVVDAKEICLELDCSNKLATRLPEVRIAFLRLVSDDTEYGKANTIVVS